MSESPNEAEAEHEAAATAEPEAEVEPEPAATAEPKLDTPPPFERPDRLDELMADPPDTPTVGSLTGYREGGRIRRRIMVVLVLGVIAAIFVGRRYARWLEERQRIPTPEYRLAEGAEGESRPDAIVWTDGPARLGISRQDPGVKAIVLPDRVLTLAPGCDHAQVKVDVRDGKTVKLKVLVGEIQETPLFTEPDPG